MRSWSVTSIPRSQARILMHASENNLKGFIADHFEWVSDFEHRFSELNVGPVVSMVYSLVHLAISGQIWSLINADKIFYEHGIEEFKPFMNFKRSLPLIPRITASSPRPMLNGQDTSRLFCNAELTPTIMRRVRFDLVKLSTFSRI